MATKKATPKKAATSKKKTSGKKAPAVQTKAVSWKFDPRISPVNPSDKNNRSYYFGIKATLKPKSKSSINHIKEMHVVWYYQIAGHWLQQPESTISLGPGGRATVTVDLPADYTALKGQVRAEAGTHKVKNKKTKKTETKRYNDVNTGWVSIPAVGPNRSAEMVTPPSTPTLSLVEPDNNRIKITVTGVGGIPGVSQIIFEVIRGLDPIAYVIGNIILGECTIYFENPEPGVSYRARAAKVSYDNEIGEYSEMSGETKSGPGSITSISASAYSDTQIRLTYSESSGATGYEVEWTDNPEYFDNNPGEVQSQSYGPVTSPIIGGLSNEGGKEWWFRVRGTNSSGESAWSPLTSCVLATVPGAPTTWTYTVSAKIGEPITFNWVHNSADASEQTAAVLEILANGSPVWGNPFLFTTESTFDWSTASLKDQDVITWRVQTKGAHSMYGEWSDYKELQVFTPPGVEVTGGIPMVITKFPITLSCRATPSTQELLSYAITVTANNSYETLDETGMLSAVPAGGTVYEYFSDDVDSNEFEIELTPGDISLENAESYTILIRVYMNSGLDGEITGEFETNFEEDELFPNCTYTFDYENLACYIEPTCYTLDVKAEEESEEDEGVDAVYTENVIYSIYRRNYDGSFTAIITDLDGSEAGAVLDPHPSLDNARYRIVATSKETGRMVYEDVVLEELNYESIVIQWDEQWTNYADNNFQDVDSIPRSGSRIDLPYNIDISVSSSPDVALVEYIGRENPVSYYGTQKGEGGSWRVEIPKDDIDTLYAIRRLSRYSGDCYVREPSGIGYWAHVKITYQETHGKMTIPITMEVTRVDGGV